MFQSTDNFDLIGNNDNVKHRSVWQITDQASERTSMILKEFLGLFSRYLDSASTYPE